MVFLLEGLAFIEGYVKGSTMLYLYPNQILDYQTVTSKVTELLGPYEYINNLVIVIELLTIVFVVAVIATLHSPKVGVHRGASIVAVGFFLAELVTLSYYSYLTEQALASLPSMISPAVLNDALQIQRQFDSAYGFWASSAYTAFRILMIAMSVVGLVGGILTCRPTVWNQSQTDQRNVVIAVRETPKVPEMVDSENAPTVKAHRAVSRARVLTSALLLVVAVAGTAYLAGRPSAVLYW
jgi:hypothetical protein